MNRIHFDWYRRGRYQNTHSTSYDDFSKVCLPGDRCSFVSFRLHIEDYYELDEQYFFEYCGEFRNVQEVLDRNTER